MMTDSSESEIQPHGLMLDFNKHRALLGKKTSHALLKLVSFGNGTDRLGGSTVLQVTCSCPTTAPERKL